MTQIRKRVTATALTGVFSLAAVFIPTFTDRLDPADRKSVV